MKRRLILATLPLASGVGLQSARAQGADDAKRLAERFAATLTAHDMAAFSDLFAETYINHQVSAAAPPPVPGKTMKQASVDFFARD